MPAGRGVKGHINPSTRLEGQLGQIPMSAGILQGAICKQVFCCSFWFLLTMRFGVAKRRGGVDHAGVPKGGRETVVNAGDSHRQTWET